MTSDLTELLAVRWYTLDQPWASSYYAGTLILAGHPDPHKGIPIIDCMVSDDDLELHEKQAIAQYIVELHNKSIAGS